jgi:hypothetical protein
VKIKYYLHGEIKYPGYCDLYLSSGGLWMVSRPSECPTRWTVLLQEKVPTIFLKEITPNEAKNLCSGREIQYFEEDC